MTAVYCSGLRSGAEPSPGLGVARSLREAFADLRIIGVAQSTRSSGLHHPVFDELWIRRPGPEASSDGDAGAILQRLDGGALWIAGSEREARWLARVAGAHDGLLSPSPQALARADGPVGDLAGRLGLLCPATVSTREQDWQLCAFGREHGWRLWLSGRGRAPTRIDGWRTLERVRAVLGAAWSADGLRLQAHVRGSEESIVFAAHRGRMVGARHLRSAVASGRGPTSGGHVADLAEVLPGVASALERELSDASWTGGGELEIVRCADGGGWLTALHPRFASWVHGATMAGANLPAALVGAATGRTPAPAASRGSDFVRVVVEIGLRRGVALPEVATAGNDVVRAGNYLSGMPDPARQGLGEGGPHPREAAVGPGQPLMAIVADLRPAASTPFVHRVDPTARWTSLAEAVRAAAGTSGGCRVEVAYSIKTDPDVELLAAARSHGFLAEAITAAEMGRATEVGFAADAIILNGPAKRWPPWQAPVRTLATFADSIGELSALAGLTRSGALTTRYLGPRLRPPSVASRFGVQVGDDGTFRALVDELRALPDGQSIGLHFHWASSEAGHATWFDAVVSTLRWGRRLQDETGRTIRCLDLGGGWQPDDFDRVLLPRLQQLVAGCRRQLDALELIVLEPGRALVQSLALVETTVLELRDDACVREIVVDASLAEVPRAGVYPHRIVSRSRDGWQHWGRGPDRVLGRLCMEDDVLRVGIAVPDDLRVGDRVLIADAGAYDRSMAYRFGGG